MPRHNQNVNKDLIAGLMNDLLVGGGIVAKKTIVQCAEDLDFKMSRTQVHNILQSMVDAGHISKTELDGKTYYRRW